MLEKLTEIISGYTGNDSIVLNESMSIVKDLDMNSLDLVNLVVLIEDAFDIEIEDEIIKELKTIEDVISFIESKQ